MWPRETKKQEIQYSNPELNFFSVSSLQEVNSSQHSIFANSLSKQTHRALRQICSRKCIITQCEILFDFSLTFEQDLPPITPPPPQKKKTVHVNILKENCRASRRKLFPATSRGCIISYNPTFPSSVCVECFFLTIVIVSVFDLAQSLFRIFHFHTNNLIHIMIKGASPYNGVRIPSSTLPRRRLAATIRPISDHGEQLRAIGVDFTEGKKPEN